MAHTMSDWVIESIQEIVSKINKAERELSPITNVYIDDEKHRSPLTGDKLQQDVRQWLSPPDPWKNYNIGRESRHTGTGTWWIQSDSYAEWKSSGPSSLLWIHGKRQYFVLEFFPEADEYCLCSGCRKERHLVRSYINGLYSLAYAIGQFCNHRGHLRVAEIWARIARVLLF